MRHDPDLSATGVEDWSIAQFERLFSGGVKFEFDGVSRWLERVEAETGIDGSEVRAVLARQPKDTVVP